MKRKRKECSQKAKKKRKSSVNTSRMTTISDKITAAAISESDLGRGDSGPVEDTGSTTKPIVEKTVPSPTPAKASAPRLILVDGKLVFDKSSLVIRNEAEASSTSKFDIVYEGPNTAISPTVYCSKRTPSKRWTYEDTNRFYEALRECGTNFSMIEMLFPERTRRQIKNKFKREERDNPQTIEEALTQHTPITTERFEELLAIAQEKEAEREQANLSQTL
eukprot:TRINITY_DN7919_c0_g1_i1.p1 TRINITY_DN7919_c0_g1~~TRINITY_DN7919_c0_g1_i1.p1  ORF type:complete len:220 (+),score=57.41 TRINITY_DN7919_c0_g1_i1:3-662(+)